MYMTHAKLADDFYRCSHKAVQLFSNSTTKEIGLQDILSQSCMHISAFREELVSIVDRHYVNQQSLYPVGTGLKMSTNTWTTPAGYIEVFSDMIHSIDNKDKSSPLYG